MRVAVHQPNFLPRLKVLQKLAASDIWVVLDNVQYCRREWQNRTTIVPVSPNAAPFWLTVPVSCPSGRDTKIEDVTIVSPDTYGRRAERSLKCAFGQAPHWLSTTSLLNSLNLGYDTGSLTSLCVSTTMELLGLAGIRPKVLYASAIDAKGKGSSLMASICQVLGASSYLADSGALNYLRLADFAGLPVLWQQWQEPGPGTIRIESWRNVSCMNYIVREGAQAFTDHMRDIRLTESATTEQVRNGK